MSYSTLLFASTSFYEGFARSIDAGGLLTEFNASLTPQQADWFAIQSDWAAVGSDLWAALQAARNQLPGSARESKQKEAVEK